MKVRLLLLFMIFTYSPGFAQTPKNDARTMLTIAQINKILGCNIADLKHEVSPSYCTYYSADYQVKVAFDITDKGSAAAASSFITSIYHRSVNDIAIGKKALGRFSATKVIAGTDPPIAFYMTSPRDGDMHSQNVLLLFIINNTAFNFYTTGIGMDKVIAKLPEIYKTVKDNYRK